MPERLLAPGIADPPIPNPLRTTLIAGLRVLSNVDELSDRRRDRRRGGRSGPARRRGSPPSTTRARRNGAEIRRDKDGPWCTHGISAPRPALPATRKGGHLPIRTPQRLVTRPALSKPAAPPTASSDRCSADSSGCAPRRAIPTRGFGRRTARIPRAERTVRKPTRPASRIGPARILQARAERRRGRVRHAKERRFPGGTAALAIDRRCLYCVRSGGMDSWRMRKNRAAALPSRPPGISIAVPPSVPASRGSQ